MCDDRANGQLIEAAYRVGQHHDRADRGQRLPSLHNLAVGGLSPGIGRKRSTEPRGQKAIGDRRRKNGNDDTRNTEMVDRKDADERSEDTSSETNTREVRDPRIALQDSHLGRGDYRPRDGNSQPANLIRITGIANRELRDRSPQQPNCRRAY